MKVLFAWLAIALSVSAVTIDARTTVLVDAGEPAALRRAAADLARDLSSVFGRPVVPVHDVSAAAPVTICVCFARDLPASVERPVSTETLAIRVVHNPWKTSKVQDAIVLTGSDPRGAIYAVYQFSQQFLGVDPMYFWTDHAPVRRQAITIPAQTIVNLGPPSFRYRGWFLNDEDLLSHWRPGTADGTGIALSLWDKVFETILRLKGNMVVPGTFLFPDEPQVRAAGERGLIISQHHIEVVGTNTYRWPDGQPYSFATRPDLLVSAWTKAVETYPREQEVIWTTGYRGRHDRSFWIDDQSAGASDADHAALIRKAIDQQMAIVRAHRAQPYFLMNAWMEAVPLIRRGLLRIPDGVTLVWPDNGFGILEDGGDIARGQGVYYHTAMHNMRANQLTESVPPTRIARELGRAARAGATEYLLVNVSDVRPVPMTTRAVMELAWNAGGWTTGGADDAYLRKWCAEEFGGGAANAVAEVYRAYFAAPGRYGPAEEQTLADNTYFTLTRNILVNELTGHDIAPGHYFSTSTEYDGDLETLARAARSADPRWTRVRALADRALASVPPERRDFYQAHVLTQIDIHRYGNRMLADAVELARQASPAGKRARLAAAIADIEAVRMALRAAEYDQWKGFYEGDLFVAVDHALALAHGYELKLQGQPVPPGLAIQLLPVDPYVKLKEYQAGRRVPL